MINIKINEINYEIAGCTQSKSWNNGNIVEMILINSINSEHQEYFNSLVGQRINAEIIDNEVSVLTIEVEYVLTEVNRHIPLSVGFGIRFEKIAA